MNVSERHAFYAVTGKFFTFVKRQIITSMKNKTFLFCIYMFALFFLIMSNLYFITNYLKVKNEIDMERQLKEDIIKYEDINCLNDLMEYGLDTAIPYAIYLADVTGNSYAEYLVYSLIESFYSQKGIAIPHKVLDYILPYLKSAADKEDPGALSQMIYLYKTGKYIPKDTSLIKNYSGKANKALEKFR